MERKADDLFRVHNLSVLKSPMPAHLVHTTSSSPVSTPNSSMREGCGSLRAQIRTPLQRMAPNNNNPLTSSTLAVGTGSSGVTSVTSGPSPVAAAKPTPKAPSSLSLSMLKTNTSSNPANGLSNSSLNNYAITTPTTTTSTSNTVTTSPSNAPAVAGLVSVGPVPRWSPLGGASRVVAVKGSINDKIMFETKPPSTPLTKSATVSTSTVAVISPNAPISTPYEELHTTPDLATFKVAVEASCATPVGQTLIESFSTRRTTGLTNDLPVNHLENQSHTTAAFSSLPTPLKNAYTPTTSAPQTCIPHATKNIIELSEWSLVVVPNNPNITKVDKKLCEEWIVLVGRRADMTELWHSSLISQRAQSSREVSTGSGRLYRLMGPLEEKAMVEAGFTLNFIVRFREGFPHDWKELLVQEFNTLVKPPVASIKRKGISSTTISINHHKKSKSGEVSNWGEVRDNETTIAVEEEIKKTCTPELLDKIDEKVTCLKQVAATIDTPQASALPLPETSVNTPQESKQKVEPLESTSTTDISSLALAKRKRGRPPKVRSYLQILADETPSHTNESDKDQSNTPPLVYKSDSYNRLTMPEDSVDSCNTLLPEEDIIENPQNQDTQTDLVPAFPALSGGDKNKGQKLTGYDEHKKTKRPLKGKLVMKDVAIKCASTLKEETESKLSDSSVPNNVSNTLPTNKPRSTNRIVEDEKRLLCGDVEKLSRELVVLDGSAQTISNTPIGEANKSPFQLSNKDKIIVDSEALKNVTLPVESLGITKDPNMSLSSPESATPHKKFHSTPRKHKQKNQVNTPSVHTPSTTANLSESSELPVVGYSRSGRRIVKPLPYWENKYLSKDLSSPCPLNWARRAKSPE